MRWVLYGGATSILCGVATASVFRVNENVHMLLAIVALVLALVAYRAKQTHDRVEVPATASLMLVLCLVGILRTDFARMQYEVAAASLESGEEVELAGVVVSEPRYSERSVLFVVETEATKVRVTTDRATDIAYGDVVTVTGKLAVPESFETDLGRTFDYQSYLMAKSITHQLSFADVSVIDDGAGNVVIDVLLQLKRMFIQSLKTVLPEPAVGLGQGILLGVDGSLGDSLEEDFRRTGIIHIVVLSGYNVMLVVAFVLFCLSPLSMRSRVIFGIGAVILFALLVGLSATVVRASAMAVLVLLAQLLHRQYAIMRALVFAGVSMVLVNPFILLYDIGFQLSFLATLGLVLLAPKFEMFLMTETQSSVIDWRGFIIATVATQIAVLPLLMYHIGEISLIAVAMNLLVLPVVPFAMMGTFTVGLIGMLSQGIASQLAFVAWLPLTYIVVLTEWASALPFATVVVPPISAWLVLVMYLIMGALLWRFREPATPDSYADWEVVEEKAGARVDERPSRAPADDLPVIFR